MAHDPRKAEVLRKARGTLARLEREANDPVEIARTAARREKIRKEEADARVDAALAKVRSQAAKGELTPAQASRREALNAKWITRHDGRGHRMSDDQFGEMETLNAIHARKPPPAPVKPAPRPAAQNERKTMSSLTSAVTEKVAVEITALRREREAYRHERELQAQKIETALARLDAVMARAEAAGADKGRDTQQSRFILTRDVESA